VAGEHSEKTLDEKVAALHRRLRSYGRVLVAFSGGVDSAFLLNEAVFTLGASNVVAATAVSETFTDEEQRRAEKICRRLRVRHEVLRSCELEDRSFVRNDPERCYHCKKIRFRGLIRLARGLDIDRVVEASQADDSVDYRPGKKAVAELNVESPLFEEGFTKAEIRLCSRHRGLETADLPAAACLASRIPYGTLIEKELLDRLARAETSVRRLGFKIFRLRHHGPVARLEFDPAEMERAFRFRRALHKRITAEGWAYVALDLLGYRTGSLNETLDRGESRKSRALGKNRP